MGEEAEQELKSAQAGLIGGPLRTPETLHVERVDGGFLINAWNATGTTRRAVAANAAGLARVVRDWAGEAK